jgi:hypothetical protein
VSKIRLTKLSKADQQTYAHFDLKLGTTRCKLMTAADFVLVDALRVGIKEEKTENKGKGQGKKRKKEDK